MATTISAAFPTDAIAPVQRRLWHELDLLCRAGIGIAPIARELAGLLRRIVGADAAAVFWLDAEGMPEGFFHEDSPAAVQDLFLNEFERLFVGADEINVLALARHRGRRVGNLLAPGRSYFRSNTFNLLVRASGHRHTLDLRVEVDGRARAVVLLFRAPGSPFAEAQAQMLARTAPWLQRALGAAARPELWQGRTARSGHVLLDPSGQRVLLVDDDAAAILKSANRRGMGLNSQHRLDTPPAFLRELCRDLAQGRPGGQVHVPMPGGALVAQAHALYPLSGWRAAAPGMAEMASGVATDAAAGATAVQVLVTLCELRPTHLDVVRRLHGLKLSPLQLEIALLAGLGQARADCTEVIGVSPEALKKHLRVIYAAAGVSDWDGLGRVLQA